MKFKSVSVVAGIAALVLSALGNVATAQMSGSAIGRWAVVNSSTKYAKGTMFSLRDQPMYAVQMRLYGRANGSVIGSVRALPRPGTTLYTLVGNYAIAPDGLTHVSAQLVFVVPNMGLPMLIMTGAFDAVLHAAPSFAADVAWKAATHGDFHARWWHH
jgi:hypothetical protein